MKWQPRRRGAHTMSWDTDTHNDQNDTPERLPLYAGNAVIGEAADTVVNGRHNALRWHEFSRTDATVELTVHDYADTYTAAQHDEDDDGDHEETGSEYISRIDGAEAVYNH